MFVKVLTTNTCSRIINIQTNVRGDDMRYENLGKRRNNSIATTLLITGSLIVAISLMISILSSTIIEGSKDIKIDYYSIQVQPGDTLWDITNHMNTTDYYTDDDYIEVVMSINNLQSQTLYQGQRLTVPVVIYPEQPMPPINVGTK